MKSFLEFVYEASNGSEKNTLGQVVTELFPCLYFLAGDAISSTAKEFPNEMWTKIKSKVDINDQHSPFYLMGPANAKSQKYSSLAGLNSIWNGYLSDDTSKSGIGDKLKQAEQIYKKILQLQKETTDKKIAAVQWGDQCQPEGIPANESDIYVSWTDGTWTGISLKATKTKSGTVSLKNRTTNTWFQALYGSTAKADEAIASIRQSVHKIFPAVPRTHVKEIYDGHMSKDKKKVQAGINGMCKWISETCASDMSQLTTLEANIKKAFNIAFAKEMDKAVKALGKKFKTSLLSVLLDENDDSAEFQLLIWKASNNSIEDMTSLSLVDNLKNAKSISFKDDGLSGIKLELIDPKSGASSYPINARQSHSLHNKTVDTLLSDVDLSGMNDTFTATIFKDISTLQIMLKLKGN